jgi:diacylglycerol kinase family enzyme
MKVCTLIHNTAAGAENYNKEQLKSIVENLGFECRYSSTKNKWWKEMDPDTDFIIIAGGDGTIRKVVKKLLNKKPLRQRFPIALLPLGTANNISKTLGIPGELEEVGKTWKEKNIKKFDVGVIDGLDKPAFFLEGFGYGIFPMLMERMREKEDKNFASLEEELKYSLEILHEIILSHKPHNLKLEIDGVDHSGSYLLAEIMNIRSIGPKLQLAPDADPGDGRLEAVLVAESQREEFANYVKNKLNNVENPFVFNSIKAKAIRMQCDANHVHIDDQLLAMTDDVETKIELIEGLLRFFVPDGKK